MLIFPPFTQELSKEGTTCHRRYHTISCMVAYFNWPWFLSSHPFQVGNRDFLILTVLDLKTKSEKCPVHCPQEPGEKGGAQPPCFRPTPVSSALPPPLLTPEHYFLEKFLFIFLKTDESVLEL